MTSGGAKGLVRALQMTSSRRVEQPVASLPAVQQARRFLGTVCILLAPICAQAGFEDGEAAHQRGDYLAAAAEWTPLAIAGRSEAEYRLGALYYEGQGVGRDYQAAFFWLGRAARKGHAPAQYLLGMQHAQGRGTAIDYQVAAVWLTKAAKSGVLPAQHALGYLYAYGNLGKRDLNKATYWFDLAARSDYTPAQVELARVLLNERNDRVDPEAANRWIARAAELGNADGQYQVAARYLSEGAYPRALELFSKAASQGQARAQATLGRMFLQGNGVQVNHAAAFDWLCKAAAQGESSAFYNLGTIFEDGLGQRRDVVLSTALRWLAQDADMMPGQTVVQPYPASFTDRDLSAVEQLAAALERPGDFQKVLDAYLRTSPMSVKPVAVKEAAPLSVERIRPPCDCAAFSPPVEAPIDGYFERYLTQVYARRLSNEIGKDQHYPDDANLNGWEGTTEVVLRMSADAKVKNVTIARSSGYSVLDEEALKKVRRVKHLPPPPDKFKGREFTVMVPIVFRLE